MVLNLTWEQHKVKTRRHSLQKWYKLVIQTHMLIQMRKDLEEISKNIERYPLILQPFATWQSCFLLWLFEDYNYIKKSRLKVNEGSMAFAWTMYIHVEVFIVTMRKELYLGIFVEISIFKLKVVILQEMMTNCHCQLGST